MNPKFKKGDIIGYRSNKYQIREIQFGPKGTYYYNVDWVDPIYDPTDHVLSIGMGGEQDMKLIAKAGEQTKLDPVEQKLVEIVNKFNAGDPITPGWAQFYAQEIRMMIAKESQ